MKDPAVFVQQLREVADWYEQHPDTPLTHEEAFSLPLYGVHTPTEAGRLLRLFAPCEKEWTASMLRIVKRFPSGATIIAVFNRSEVCTRNVVGMRIIPARVIEEHEEEIVEWDCGPLLAAEAEPEPAYDPA